MTTTTADDAGRVLLDRVRTTVDWLVDDDTLAVAGRLLGVPAREVDHVAGHPGGVELSAGGELLVWVPPEAPDGAGRSGLMLQSPSPSSRMPAWTSHDRLDVDTLVDLAGIEVDPTGFVTVGALEEALAAAADRRRLVGEALKAVSDVDGLEVLAGAERRLEAIVKGLENRRPWVVHEEQRRAALAAEAVVAEERRVLDELFLAVQPAMERFLVDYDALVRRREQALEAGAPAMVAVGGAGGDFRGFLVTDPDGNVGPARYPRELVPVFDAADRFAELLRGDWQTMIERLRAAAAEAGSR